MNRTTVALWAVLVAGIAVRFAGLGHWSLDGDEIYSWYDVESVLAGEPWPDGVRSHPLGYLGMAAFVNVGGLSEFVLRLFSALAGSGALLALAFLRRDVVPRCVALFATLFAAASPWLLYHAQSARFYGPLVLFATLATLWVLPGASRRPWASGCAFVAAVFCHPSALFLGPCLVLSLMGVSQRRARVGLLAAVGAGGVALLWMFAGGWEVLVRAYGTDSPSDYGVVAFSLGLGYNVGPALGLAALAGLVAVGRGEGGAGPGVALCALLPPVLLMAVALLGVSTHQRYAMAAVPAMMLLAGWGVVETWRRRRAWGVGLVALVLVSALPGQIAHARDGNRHDMRALASWLAEHAATDDLLVLDEHATVELYLAHEPGFAEVKSHEVPINDRKMWGFLRNRHEVWVAVKVSKLGGAYGAEFTDWLAAHFTEVARLGSEPPPFVRHDNHLVVYRRTERLDPRDAEPQWDEFGMLAGPPEDEPRGEGARGDRNPRGDGGDRR